MSKNDNRGSVQPQSKQEYAAKVEKQRQKQEGVLFWTVTRLDREEFMPVFFREPYPKDKDGHSVGKSATVKFRGIKDPDSPGRDLVLRKPRRFTDRGLIIMLVGKSGVGRASEQGVVCFDKKELLASGILTQADLDCIAKGEHPDAKKDGPNDEPVKRLTDIGMINYDLAMKLCQQRGLLVKPNADINDLRRALREFDSR